MAGRHQGLSDTVGLGQRIVASGGRADAAARHGSHGPPGRPGLAHLGQGNAGKRQRHNSGPVTETI
jgi:hypothetical protein